MGFKANFFDCVTCFDVLEHDADIRGNLKEIYRILKPGGLLVIQVPNCKSAMAYLCGQHWDWWSVPDHVLHFIPPVLSKILEDNDIETEFYIPPGRDIGSSCGMFLIDLYKKYNLKCDTL